MGGHAPEGTTTGPSIPTALGLIPVIPPTLTQNMQQNTLRVICDTQGSASVSLFALDSNPSPFLQDRKHQQSPWQPRNKVPTPLLTATNPGRPRAVPPWHESNTRHSKSLHLTKG